MVQVMAGRIHREKFGFLQGKGGLHTAGRIGMCRIQRRESMKTSGHDFKLQSATLSWGAIVKVKVDGDLLKIYHMDSGVVFYHQNDERAFFEWIERIPCFKSYESGYGHGLTVCLSRRPKKDELRDIIALCYRYGVDMRQLGKFETKRNSIWFRDPSKYWYSRIF